MIICICHNVNEKKINEVMDKHEVHTLKQLQSHLDICHQCRKCAIELRHIIHQKNQVEPKLISEQP